MASMTAGLENDLEEIGQAFAIPLNPQDQAEAVETILEWCQKKAERPCPQTVGIHSNNQRSGEH